MDIIRNKKPTVKNKGNHSFITVGSKTKHSNLNIYFKIIDIKFGTVNKFL